VKTPGASDWVKKQCASAGANCLEQGCCADEGMQCYAKDVGWAECKYGCMDPDAPWKGDGWSCEEIGPRTPQGPWIAQMASQKPVADWVAQECANGGEDCTHKQCCVEEGHQCYVKVKGWSACRADCPNGPDLWDVDDAPWNCSTLGPRTPGFAQSNSGHRPVADWVKNKCAKRDADCRETRCCIDEGHRCYEKNDGWATCKRMCDAGKQEYDAGNESWTCNELGPRTPRPWGSPSLFCFNVVTFNEWSSEPELVKGQIERGAGIFECDEYAVFSTVEPIFVGIGPMGKVTSIQFEPAEITTSKDGTSGNAELFMHVWDAVQQDGRWSTTDWTVKVDPDAVLITSRLRLHLEEPTGTAAYIVNCNKPYMPEGPMMFGALEALSEKAMEAYFNRGHECIANMMWKSWGEDWFMGHCLDFLQVTQVHDYDIYSDGVCTGVDCGHATAAAFHPKKDIDSWIACYEQATSSSEPEPVHEDDGGGDSGDEVGDQGGAQWQGRM